MTPCLPFQITPIPAFQDNYIWTLHNQRVAVLIDPGDASPCIAFLEQHGLILSAILNTHHHHDHTGGNEALSARYHPRIYGPQQEAIPFVTHPVNGGDRVTLTELGITFHVLATPGHTLGHVIYHIPAHDHGADLLFCGDTLFSCGCGRLFEGTPAKMLSSLKQISRLPDNTAVFCAHEYTLSNISFARKVDPDNQKLAKYEKDAQSMRHSGQPTLPSTLALEKRVNPFLRCNKAALVNTVASWLGRPPVNELEVFSELRKAKDHFQVS